MNLHRRVFVITCSDNPLHQTLNHSIPCLAYYFIWNPINIFREQLDL